MRWQPLRVPDGAGGFSVQKYLTPQWGGVTPFALSSPDQFLPPGPTKTTLLLLDQEITDTLLQSATLTDLTKTRAEYWADGPHSETPPGHWILFAGAVVPGPWLRPRPEREAHLRRRQRRAGRQHRRLERQASLGLRPPDHRGPHPDEGQARTRLGRPGQGHPADPRGDLDGRTRP